MCIILLYCFHQPKHVHNEKNYCFQIFAFIMICQSWTGWMMHTPPASMTTICPPFIMPCLINQCMGHPHKTCFLIMGPFLNSGRLCDGGMVACLLIVICNDGHSHNMIQLLRTEMSQQLFAQQLEMWWSRLRNLSIPSRK